MFLSFLIVSLKKIQTDSVSKSVRSEQLTWRMTEKSLVSINESVYYGSAEYNNLAIFWIEAHKS